MVRHGTVMLGFMLFVLLGVIAIPAALQASEGTATETVTMSSEDSKLIGEHIEVLTVETTNTEATITVINRRDGTSITQTIGEGQTGTFSFDHGDIDVTVENTTNERATLFVEYPSTFGFSDGALVIVDNLAIIIVSMFFIAVAGFVGIRV